MVCGLDVAEPTTCPFARKSTRTMLPTGCGTAVKVTSAGALKLAPLVGLLSATVGGK